MTTFALLRCESKDEEMMMNSNGFVTKVLLTGILCAAGCLSEGGAAEHRDNSEPLRNVVVAQVGRRDMLDERRYVANIVPVAEVDIYSLVSERVVYFPWNDGDVVKKGEIVARIRSTGIQYNLAEMKAEIDALDVQLAQQKADTARSKSLYEENAVSKQAYEQMMTGYRSAEAKRKSLEATLSRIGVQAGNAVIRAPMTGIIMNKHVREGDTANPQVALCKLIAIDSVKLTIDIVEADIGKVRVGQNVQVVVDAYPNRTFEAKVVRVLPYMNAATRTNTAEILISNPTDETSGERMLKPGMFARVTAIVAEHKAVVAVPAQALLLNANKDAEDKSEREAVVINDAGAAEIRKVKCGLQNGPFTEVLEGLDNGDLIVTRGQHGIKDGQPVHVVNEIEDFANREVTP